MKKYKDTAIMVAEKTYVEPIRIFMRYYIVLAVMIEVASVVSIVLGCVFANMWLVALGVVMPTVLTVPMYSIFKKIGAFCLVDHAQRDMDKWMVMDGRNNE